MPKTRTRPDANGTGTGSTLPWRQMIPVHKLRPNPDNPREDPGDIAGLAASIQANGLKQWLLVSRDPDGDTYPIEEGWRRWLAMKDWATEIPCVIAPPLSAEDRAVRNVTTALITDVHKKPLNPVERATGFDQLVKAGKSQPEIAALTGLSVSTVSNSLALLEFSAKDQDKIRSGEMSAAEALAIVHRVRARKRRKQGQAAIGPVWEPPWFTRAHPLARTVRAMCNAREHTARRRYDKTGCGECWETVIRADERVVIAATAQARESFTQAMGEVTG